MILTYQVKRDFGTEQQLVAGWTDEKMAIADCAQRNQEQAVLEKRYVYIVEAKQE